MSVQPAIGTEKVSEVFLKALFKPKMSPPPKPPFLWGGGGGRRLPFKGKSYTLQVSLEGKNVGDIIWVSELFYCMTP